MNKVTLIGNLTRDPEVASINDGTSICTFSIAVSRNYSDDVDFFQIVAWRGLADNCGRYLSKGSKVCVVGSIQNNNYQDKEGVMRYKTQIVASEVEFLNSKSKSSDDSQDYKPNNRKKEESSVEDDDDQLPF